MVDAVLVPHDDDPDTYEVDVRWERLPDVPPESDTGLVWSRHVAVSYITRLAHHPRPDLEGPEKALAGLFG